MATDQEMEDHMVAADQEKSAASGIEDVHPKKRQREDDDDASNNDDAQTNTEPKLSKNQLRKQKRAKLREERREDRKLHRKEKRHERTARKRTEREDKAEELAKTLGIDKAEALTKIVEDERQLKKEQSQRSRSVPVTFIIDCDFEQYMREGELISLSSQVTRSYAMNKTGLFHAHLLMSSWGGKLKERFETTLNNSHTNWKGVTFTEQDFLDAGKQAWNIMKGPKGGQTCPALGEPKTLAEDEEFTSDSIIYLSADSDETLDKLEPYTSYVIGGLVDRNREKNLCQKRAVEKGVRTAKLPIGEYMQMASRKVLATNHVVEIMSKWLETGDWGKAFAEVIPKRKGCQLKGDEGDEVDGEDQEIEAKEAEEQRGGDEKIVDGTNEIKS